MKTYFTFMKESYTPYPLYHVKEETRNIGGKLGNPRGLIKYTDSLGMQHVDRHDLLTAASHMMWGNESHLAKHVKALDTDVRDKVKEYLSPEFKKRHLEEEVEQIDEQVSFKKTESGDHHIHHNGKRVGKIIKTKSMGSLGYSVRIGNDEVGTETSLPKAKESAKYHLTSLKEQEELDEAISKMSDGRLKWHINTGVPHGSYTKDEMKKERDHRLKTDPIGYRNAKPAMKEEAEQIDEISKKKIGDYSQQASKEIIGNQPADKDKLRKRNNREKFIKLAYNKYYGYKTKVPATIKEEELDEIHSTAITYHDHIEAKEMTPAEIKAKHKSYLDTEAHHRERSKDPNLTSNQRMASGAVASAAKMAAAEWKHKYVKEEAESVDEANSHREVDDLKSKGKHHEAGILAAKSSHDRQYGAHFGMRSGKEEAQRQFFKGYDSVKKTNEEADQTNLGGGKGPIGGRYGMPTGTTNRVTQAMAAAKAAAADKAAAKKKKMARVNLSIDYDEIGHRTVDVGPGQTTTVRSERNFKEEAEQIDELSRTGILQRYSDETRRLVDRGVEEPENRKKMRLLAGKKRWGGTGGIASAKVPATNEEIELDENWNEGVSSTNSNLHKNAGHAAEDKAKTAKIKAGRYAKDSEGYNNLMSQHHTLKAKSIKHFYHAGMYGSKDSAKKDHDEQIKYSKEYKSVKEEAQRVYEEHMSEKDAERLAQKHVNAAISAKKAGNLKGHDAHAEASNYIRDKILTHTDSAKGIPSGKILSTAKKLFGESDLAEKEEMEINELDRGGIISRYIRKAGPGGSESFPKRKKGVDLALLKKWGDKGYGLPEPKVKAVQREEVEPLAEISAALARRASRLAMDE